MIIGLDHGAKGALVALCPDGSIHSVLKMPLKNGDISPSKIQEWVLQFPLSTPVVCEKLRGIYGVSRKATFGFGRNIGIVSSVLSLTGFKIHEVDVKTWQNNTFKFYSVPKIFKNNTLKKCTKSMALCAALTEWPNLPTDIRKKDGIIDALMIAKYFQRVN